MILNLLCWDCLHFRRQVPFACDAFADGIPEAILDGTVEHTSPYPGDNGIQFEPIDGAEAAE